MKYFTVEKEMVEGRLTYYTSDDEGAPVSDCWTGGDAIITTGFSVHIYDENGIHEDTEFYPVITDTTNNMNNEEEVLEKIKKTYPAGEWQNNDW